MTRNQQMLELIRIHGPILLKDLAPIAERTHGISKTMTTFVLAQLKKLRLINGRRIGQGNTQEYSLASTPPPAAPPAAQPKERGRAKPHPPAASNSESRSEPRYGGGPLFSGCADPATDAVIANLFEDDPDGQDLAEQVMQAIGKSAGLQTATQIRPHEVEAITFNTVLSKLVKAGCLGRGWIGDHAKGSYRYGKPGHPDLAELLPERPKAPTGDQVQSTVELAAGQGAAVRATDGVVTQPGHALPAIEPTPDRMATKLNQAPAPTATKPADPATEPVTPCEVDSQAGSAVSWPDPPMPWPTMATELDRIGELDDPIPPTPAGLLIGGLLDLDDLIGDLCDRQAPHAAIRAAQTASASLRHGLVGLLTASGASS